jgi:methionine synthase II (cobalamin-independent)
VSERAYHSVPDLYPEIGRIVRHEVEALIAEGVPYIQIDAPRYTYFVDERWRQRFRDQGEDLRRRIDEAAQHFPMENLALSPQCGFATFADSNPLSWDEQRWKLELVVETARRAWG